MQISEVAKLAGVSSATVSRHMSGGRVRRAEEIAVAISQLNYRPNPNARSLRSGRQRCVGVIVPDITNPFFSDLVGGVETVLAQQGIRVLLANSNEDLAMEASMVADFVDRTDGLILFPPTETDRILDEFVDESVPVVLVDRTMRDSKRADVVLVDNAAGASMAADHLVALGHRRLGMISGPATNTPGRERHDAFLAASASGGDSSISVQVVVSDFRVEGGYAAMTELLSASPPITCVFSANNLMTIGALRALADHGVSVPDEISIVGFDDLDLADLLASPLTVIDRPSDELGSIAASLLLQRIQDPGREFQYIRLPVSLLVRASTAPPCQSWRSPAVETTMTTTESENP